MSLALSVQSIRLQRAVITSLMTNLKTVIFCPLSPVMALSRGAGESSCHFGRKNVYMKQYIMEANIKNTNTKRSQRRSQYSEIDLVGPSLFDATCQSLLKIKTMKLTVA